MHNTITTDSASKKDGLTEILTTQKGIDIWRIDSRGTMDLRMSRELYTTLREAIPDCHLLAESVEDLVQEAEQAMSSPKANIWEELLTEEVEDGMAS